MGRAVDVAVASGDVAFLRSTAGSLAASDEVNGLHDSGVQAHRIGALIFGASLDASDARAKHSRRACGGLGFNPETETYLNLLTARDVYKREESKTTKKARRLVTT